MLEKLLEDMEAFKICSADFPANSLEYWGVTSEEEVKEIVVSELFRRKVLGIAVTVNLFHE